MDRESWLCYNGKVLNFGLRRYRIAKFFAGSAKFIEMIEK